MNWITIDSKNNSNINSSVTQIITASEVLTEASNTLVSVRSSYSTQPTAHMSLLKLYLKQNKSYK